MQPYGCIASLHLAKILGTLNRLSVDYFDLRCVWFVVARRAQEADVVAAPLYVTDQRQEVVDFAVPFLVVEAAVLLRRLPGVGNEAVARARTVADLLALPPDVVRFGTLNAGLIIRSLRTSNSSLHRELFARMRNQQQQHPRSSSFSSPSTSTTSGFTTSNEDGIDRVRVGTDAGAEYAFVLPRPIADYVARRRPCGDLRVVAGDGDLPVEHWALAVPRGSGLRPQLNRVVAEMVAGGFVTQAYARWILDETECSTAAVAPSAGSYAGRTGGGGGSGGVRSSKMLSSRAASTVISSSATRLGVVGVGRLRPWLTSTTTTTMTASAVILLFFLTVADDLASAFLEHAKRRRRRSRRGKGM